jgi:hypothetical protein
MSLCLAFLLEWHHELFFESRARCCVFLDGGNPEGYAYVRPSGGIGPAAVRYERYMKSILQTAFSLAAGQKVEKVFLYMPGSNVHAVDLALKCKMKFEPQVLMSTGPFAKWQNYIFNSSALM